MIMPFGKLETGCCYWLNAFMLLLSERQSQPNTIALTDVDALHICQCFQQVSDLQILETTLLRVHHSCQ